MKITIVTLKMKICITIISRISIVGYLSCQPWVQCHQIWTHAFLKEEITINTEVQAQLHRITEIPKTDEVKYLGITLNKHLKFAIQIVTSSNKAGSMLGFVRRNLSVKSTEVKIVACKSLVRPLMEYSSASWAKTHVEWFNAYAMHNIILNHSLSPRT